MITKLRKYMRKGILIDVFRFVRKKISSSTPVVNLRARTAGRNYAALRKFEAPKVVIFLVSENQKWNGDSLYWALDDDDGFDPLVVVAPFERWDGAGYEKTSIFMKERGYKVADGLDLKSNTIINLIEFNPFIVLYQQPWNVHKGQDVMTVSRYAFTGYIPYGIEVTNHSESYDMPFHYGVYRIYVDSEMTYRRYIRGNPSIIQKCIVTGHPKLDQVLDDLSTDPMVIYAPHHSFEMDGLRYATFDWSGKEMLEFARQNQGVKFILKPHPRFKVAVIRNNIMQEAEYDNYINSWEELPNCSIYDQGDYQRLFAQSTHMVTDCASFLAEYFVTKKPLVLLSNPQSTGYSELGEYVIKYAYKAANKEELSSIMKDLILDGRDVNKDVRMKYDNIFESGESATSGIVKDLVSMGDGQV